MGLLAALIVNTSLLAGWAFLNDKIGYLTERSAWEYCNPLLILETVLIFMLFQLIPVRKHIFINGINVLAKGVFSVYLLHIFFLQFIPAENLAIENIILLWVQLILCSIIIFLICYGIHCIYSFLIKPVHQLIDQLFGKFVLDVPEMTIKNQNRL